MVRMRQLLDHLQRNRQPQEHQLEAEQPVLLDRNHGQGQALPQEEEGLGKLADQDLQARQGLLLLGNAEPERGGHQDKLREHQRRGHGQRPPLGAARPLHDPQEAPPHGRFRDRGGVLDGELRQHVLHLHVRREGDAGPQEGRVPGLPLQGD